MKYLKTNLDVVVAIIVVVLLYFILSGCVTKKACDRKFPPQIVTNTTIHDTMWLTKYDTTIIVKPDSASMKAKLKCDSLGNVLVSELLDYKTGKKVTIRWRVIDNILYVECDYSGYELIINLQQQHYRQTIDRLKTVTITTWSPNWWEKLYLTIGKSFVWVLLGLIIIGLIVFTVKIYIKKS
jgi:hypothetical protein